MQGVLGAGGREASFDWIDWEEWEVGSGSREVVVVRGVGLVTLEVEEG